MKIDNESVKIKEILHELKHLLPAQAPLKDFVHHNTLHGFQSFSFFEGLNQASNVFGYQTLLSLAEYRIKWKNGEISEPSILSAMLECKVVDANGALMNKLKYEDVSETVDARIGQLRREWIKHQAIDLDSMVHPSLFRILCSYLDQGISTWRFPEKNLGFLDAMKQIESNSQSSFFNTKEARNWLLTGNCNIEALLHRLVGDESRYEQYLFDQQFSHQGWSGIVVSIEMQPSGLLDTREISLYDLIVFELLLELDVMVMKLGPDFAPLSVFLLPDFAPLLSPSAMDEHFILRRIWQIALEKSYHTKVLQGIQANTDRISAPVNKSFQALFCIDDRECSLRRHVETLDSNSETFGTPGFFGVAFYYQPEGGKFKTKLCPAPVTPKHLIKAFGVNEKRKKDAHFHKQTHSLLPGFLISQTLGFWSAVKLFYQIFKPTMSPATSTSLQHMHKESQLTVHHKGEFEDGLQVGYTQAEMANLVEATLKSIGLIKDFAPFVYLVSHGSSSVNNPHFSAYDCGACCGRPGSVNARVFCAMVNDLYVREELAKRNINIPSDVAFVGALHDTSRDEMVFYDEELLNEKQREIHLISSQVFLNALKNNALERSRRFVLLDKTMSKDRIFDRVRNRSVSLFEPRPELNHATNALCIVGSRNMTRGLFMDRRAFLNSYDPDLDVNGDLLFGILKAAAPVCGGINLEYFFSRVDNQKLGAGSKLPHNVMGLIGVANGIDGDLRPGLPAQMVEVHDPLRLLIVVEQEPEKVLQVIQRDENTYQWFINDWIKIVTVSPKTKKFHQFKSGSFNPLEVIPKSLKTKKQSDPIFINEINNLPLMLVES